MEGGSLQELAHGRPRHVEGSPAPGQRAEPGVNPHPRTGHSSNNEGRRDVGDFGCLVFDSLGWQAWTQSPPSPRLCRQTVRWPTPGPEDSAALFRCAAVGSCASCSQGFFRGDRVRIVGRHGHRLRCRWTAASGELLGRRLDQGRSRGIAETPRAHGQNGRIP